GVDVRARLGAGRVATLVGEVVAAVGAAHDRAGELVGVGPVGGEPLAEAHPAVDLVARGEHRGGGAAVVRLRGRVDAEADDVGAAARVGAEEVVDLLLGELEEAGGLHGLGAAHHRLVDPAEDVAVGDEEEGRAGDVLGVGAVAEVDHAARGDGHLVERGVREHGAHEVVGLGLEALEAAAGCHVELREEHLRARELEVPAELGHARRDRLVPDEVRVHLPLRRQVQPRRRPQQLILIDAVTITIYITWALAVVGSLVRLGELEQLLALLRRRRE
ncbi:Os02g0778633, partial [Oryza sativa Japonica Group]